MARFYFRRTVYGLSRDFYKHALETLPGSSLLARLYTFIRGNTRVYKLVNPRANYTAGVRNEGKSSATNPI